ncbi:MAG: sugar O-acetyltransferase [Bacteroides sp.]|nr:sugar O-acetyltransferase [Prevotella sp.]MCM1408025.1 sugar O-acetyltransferase [Treponema brennaborense]MCM1469001.1 sugar O-acetyltransferase [Bacteroides sp.]
MTEREKAASGYLFDANDETLKKERTICKDLCFEFNLCKPSDTEKQRQLLHRIFGGIKDNAEVTAPFWCDYGYNIFVGSNFYANHNCVILDTARITFGDNVFIAPNCCFSAAGHPLDAEQRSKGLEIALPISIGNNVWIGAGVTVVPGVAIGDNTVIGAGSVVVKNIPSDVLAAGNPCRVIRKLTEKDKEKYRHL